MGSPMGDDEDLIRVLCSPLVTSRGEPVFQWLIGSHFLPRFSILSTCRCMHMITDSSSPDHIKESEDIRTLVPKGFEVIGALKPCAGSDVEVAAREAMDEACRLRKLLNYSDCITDQRIIGAVLNLLNSDVEFFISRNENCTRIERVKSVTYDDRLAKSVWENGCLLRCVVPIKFPVYLPLNNVPDAEKMYMRGFDSVVAMFKDSQMVYLFSKSHQTSSEESPMVVRGDELDLKSLSNMKFEDKSNNSSSSGSETICADLCRSLADSSSLENADVISVSILRNTCSKLEKSVAPSAEYFPALDKAKVCIIDVNLDVLCYAAKGLPLKSAVSMFIIPGLVDQLNSMKKIIFPKFLTKHPQIYPYHFNPPGMLHPVTAIYELDCEEPAQKQVEIRKTLHTRLGLPLDRPLLRIANAIDFSSIKDSMTTSGRAKGRPQLRDVHNGIPNSGVSDGCISLVQGSYEYYHYLQDGFDDSGWGCAYRSLQTIISWFRLQHYTTIDVPSHRKIQEALVEIGDKEPSFIGSRDWIGAIELSFVLDKLLGVTCKIMNVRSGAELPEKCRELSLHFENQGTPVMIGGGVLAYTLLGVDYNEKTGDCAFLILDPHYTGTDDHKKITNGGWCGWKKAVDNKGNNFFLHHKFYNLLMPHRSNII